ncbi:MAG: hypothetical protein HYR86_03650 [Candidatus Rokubacteria bacterium]|nr:hypothetical protein [Candidatus Rokubacteria bacterium]
MIERPLRSLPFLGLGAILAAVLVSGDVPATAQPAATAEASNMRLVGHADLQGRSAYQPLVRKHGARWIAYVGHHGGQAVNPLTGVQEPNGTSLVDVTDPADPRQLFHIPGAPGGVESGGAQMVRVCEGAELPRAARDRIYLLRTLGNLAHEVWDVTDPASPAKVTTVVSGLAATHKNWWECDTGIAYLVSDGRPQGWRTNRMTKIFDLGDPVEPRFIRDFGLAGQQPGATGVAPDGVHGPIAYGDRVYLPYGTSQNGVLQIVDRTRLLEGSPAVADRFAPTPANLAYPQIGRLDIAPAWGGHTSFPILGVPIADFAANSKYTVQDFVLLVSESIFNECQEVRHLSFLIDITTPSKPFPISSYQVPERAGEFCARGGRFGPHSSNESFTPIYYRKLVFIAYFNAGVRAVDIRDPYHPREAGFFIPAITDKTDVRCVKVDGADRCKRAIQTNNVEVDERGLIYTADRANTGLHILELTGPARAIARSD